MHKSYLVHFLKTLPPFLLYSISAGLILTPGMTSLGICADSPDKSQEEEPMSLESFSKSMDEILQMKISGANREKKSFQSTPAIVTVVTAQEIHDMGARDLVDVLNLVPGITLATDTQGVVGLAIRGMWAHEGKVLLLIDGEEMNEISFNSTQFGNHYPVDSIERLEVIKGPGSATHGGYAELAVINIVSKDANQLNGLVFNGIYGQTAKTFAQRNIGIGFGKKYSDWNVSAYGFLGQGNRSDRDYTDDTGAVYNLADNSKLNPNYLNIGISNDRWSFRFIYDQYNMTDKTGFGDNVSTAVQDNFGSILLGIKYNANLSNSISIMPEIHLKENQPWNSTDPALAAFSSLYYNVVDDEIKAAISGRAQITPQMVAYLGIEGKIQTAHDFGSPTSVFSDGTQEVAYYSKAAFTEIDLNTDIADFLVGGRYEGQNVGGDAFVPRVSAVKQFGDFHAKAIYSWGFRVPGIENLRTNSTLLPETSKVAEIEFGAKLSDKTFTSLNFFSAELINPIIYGYANGSQSYNNRSSSGTYGLEWNYKIRSSWGYGDISYSFFQPNGNPPIDYQTGYSGTLLGMANHKVTLNTKIQILNDHTHLNLSEIFLSQRYGYDYDPNASSGVSVKSFSAASLTNLFLERSDLFYPGLTVGAGVFNLLDQDFRYIQPYDGSHPPLPSTSRDWVLKASYQVKI